MSSAVDDYAERQALALARQHYENFPVASILLPRRYRAPVALLYSFARRADDLADEGARSVAQRLAELAALRRQLDLARAGRPCDDRAIAALAQVMHEFALPWDALHDLLSAFTQDVTVARYSSFEELADYCARSANPVGRLLLHLYGAASPRNLDDSDAVCTALQLINFLQDLESDYRLRGRIYVPLDEMARFGVDEAHFRQRRSDEPMHSLCAFQLQRAAGLLEAGAPLGRVLPGRLGLELRAIVAGGRRTVAKLRRRRDVFTRPRLHAGDWLAVTWAALTPFPRKPGRRAAS